MRARRTRGRGDNGVTLVELIAAIFLSLVITGVIGNVLITALRTNDNTVSRLAASHDTQLIGTWLQVDVESAAPTMTATDASAQAADCPGATGDNVLRVPYAAAPDDDNSIANYRFSTSGGESRLTRYLCRNGTTVDRNVLATNLTEQPIAEVTGSGPVTVTMTVNEPVKTANGTQIITVKYTAQSRTPVTVPTTTTTPPPPTTPPCSVTSATATPNPVAMASSSTLASDVAVTINAVGCTLPLTVSFTPGSGGAQTIALSQSGNTFTGTLSATAYAWTSGAKTITVNQDGGGSVSNSTFTLTVTGQPCTTTSFSVAPSTVPRVPGSGGGARRLSSDVTVTAQTSGACAGLQVRFTPTSNPSTQTQNMTQSGSTWTYLIPGPSGVPWSTGSHTLTLLNTNDVTAPTATLVVT